jgi:DNA-binding CsgD family transcriptional regulator
MMFYCSERQLEILNLVKKGLTNREIAKELSLSVRTVETHISRLLATTETKNRTELVNLTRDKKFITNRITKENTKEEIRQKILYLKRHGISHKSIEARLKVNVTYYLRDVSDTILYITDSPKMLEYDCNGKRLSTTTELH